MQYGSVWHITFNNNVCHTQFGPMCACPRHSDQYIRSQYNLGLPFFLVGPMYVVGRSNASF